MEPTLDDVLAEGFLGDVATLPVEELRSKRDACRRLEAVVSYQRRVVQGQLDILRAEAGRREAEGADVSGVLEALPLLLGTGSPSSARGDVRSTPIVAPEDAEGEHLGDVSAISDAELEDLAHHLAEREKMLSGQRQALFRLIDGAQDEIAGRYKSGDALVADVINERL